jgi:hypothetical protein
VAGQAAVFGVVDDGVDRIEAASRPARCAGWVLVANEASIGLGPRSTLGGASGGINGFVGQVGTAGLDDGGAAGEPVAQLVLRVVERGKLLKPAPIFPGGIRPLSICSQMPSRSSNTLR